MAGLDLFQCIYIYYVIDSTILERKIKIELRILSCFSH